MREYPIFVGVRLRENESAKLAKLAKQAGLSQSAMLRALLAAVESVEKPAIKFSK